MIETILGIDYRKHNPLFYYLLSYFTNPDFRNIILYGGSSSGKSYSVAQAIIWMTYYDDENTIIFRKVGASITKTIYEDFKVAARQMGVFDELKFKDSLRQIVFPSGAKIDFQGLDDPEKIKGISNYKRVVLEEWSEYDEEDDKQIRKRLRGKKGQQRIMMFNPISETHWIKTEIFDKETWNDVEMKVRLFGKKINSLLTKVKSLRINSPKQIFNPRTREWEEHAPDTVAIQTTYLNNFWVVGSPCGTFGYYDRQCIADFEKDRLNDPNYYNIYALGEWGVLRTGSEFFGSFNRGVHCNQVEYIPDLPIHLSVDNNFLPYITTTLWQIDTTEGTHIRQLGEVMAEPPNNDVRKAAKLVAEKLKEYGALKVYLHGDASTRNANTIDEEKRSFLDLYIDTLQKEAIEVEDKVGNKNPSVQMSGEFINAIFEGLIEDSTLTIGENCKISINDYLGVQKDVNGAILKLRVRNKVTGQSYEEYGHASDCMRYLVVDVLSDSFIMFTNKRKRNIYAKDGQINFFNPETKYEYWEEMVYCIPDIDNKFGMVHAKRIDEKWHIVGATLENWSPEYFETLITGTGCSKVIMECTKQYYQLARDLREKVEDVRVLHLQSDLDARIKATSDFVKESVLFNPGLNDSDRDYAMFINSLLDYNQNNKERGASAVLSGFAKYAIKSQN